MLLLSSNSPTVRQYGERHPGLVGWLLVPRNRAIGTYFALTPWPWAADNDCYNGTFDGPTFAA